MGSLITMRKKRIFAMVAAVSAVGLVASACGGKSASSAGSSTNFNAANTSIVNASAKNGGTLKLASSSTFDSLDGGVTYQATTWDLYRMFDRTMLAAKDQPGTAGLELEGDLATGPATGTDNNTVWTYNIQPNAKYSDGNTITAADVKYAIERSNFDASGTLSGGPSYFANLIQNTTNYQGPFKDKNASNGVSGIVVKSPTTIEFHLKQSFADFNYLMTLPQTTPVERSKEQGTSYSTNVAGDSFTGAYEVQSYSPGKSLVLVPNPDYSSASDPNGVHVRNASKVVMTLGLDQTTVDQDLLQGSEDIDIHGLGVGTATQSKILQDPSLKALSDVANSGMQMYMQVNTQVAPLTNVDCRRAIEWAVNKKQVQNVAGGSIGGGAIATTVLPTSNTAYVDEDQYASPGEEGDASKAEAEVATCKTALGSAYTNTFSLATYDTQSHPKFIAAAQVIQQNLKAIGFNVTINQYNYGDNTFFKDAGGESFAKSHSIGLSLWAWSADFPTGYGYMDQILGKDGIQPSGISYNMAYWNDSTYAADMTAALSASTPAATNAAYAKADHYAMSQAVLVPLLNMSNLLYRSPNTTNVTVSQFYGMYDYSILGTTN